MSKTIKNLIAMARPPVAFILVIFALIGATNPGIILEPSWSIIVIAITAVSILINAACVNDLADEAIDKINLKGSGARPLANNIASRRQIWTFGVLSAVLALMLGFTVGTKFLLVVVTGLLFNWFYSMRPFQISRNTYLAPMLLPIGYVVTPFMLGVYGAGGLLNWQKASLLISLYLCFIGRIILKDFRDVVGDKKFNKQTFILKHGQKATCGVSASFWISGLGALVISNRVFIWPVILALPFILVALITLSKEKAMVAQQSLIWAIARVGTAISITIFAGLQLVNQPAIQLAIISIAIFVPFAGMYLEVIGDLILRPGGQTFMRRIFSGVGKNQTKQFQDPIW